MVDPTLRVFWAPPRFVADLRGAQADVVGHSDPGIKTGTKKDRHEDDHYRRVEVITGRLEAVTGRRRRRDYRCGKCAAGRQHLSRRTALGRQPRPALGLAAAGGASEPRRDDGDDCSSVA